MVGIISTVDINNRVVAEGKNPNGLKAKDIMTSPIRSFEEDADEKEAYSTCVKDNIVTCPVTKDGRIVGIVSIHELLRKITHVN